MVGECSTSPNVSGRGPPDATTKARCPGVWPALASVDTPGEDLRVDADCADPRAQRLQHRLGDTEVGPPLCPFGFADQNRGVRKGCRPPEVLDVQVGDRHRVDVSGPCRARARPSSIAPLDISTNTG